MKKLKQEIKDLKSEVESLTNANFNISSRLAATQDEFLEYKQLVYYQHTKLIRKLCLGIRIE